MPLQTNHLRPYRALSRALQSMLVALCLVAPLVLGRVTAQEATRLAVEPIAPAAPAAASEADAAALLQEAIEELRLGEQRAARRRLAILIRQFAGTRAADEARRLLAGMATRSPLPARSVSEAARSDFGPGRLRPVSRAMENDFKSVVGDRVFFAGDSAELGARARAVLAQHARWLRTHARVGVVVEAFADEPGSRERNMALARERGAAVRDRLVEDGVAATRIEVIARGREARLATCDAPQCAAQNRRAVVSLKGELSPAAPAGEVGTRAAPAPR